MGRLMSLICKSFVLQAAFELAKGLKDPRSREVRYHRPPRNVGEAFPV